MSGSAENTVRNSGAAQFTIVGDVSPAITIPVFFPGDIGLI